MSFFTTLLLSKISCEKKEKEKEKEKERSFGSFSTPFS